MIVGHKPRQGSRVGAQEGGAGWQDEDDVVEGIVMMRKYEKSLPTAEAVPPRWAKSKPASAPQGNAHQRIQSADRPRSRHET